MSDVARLESGHVDAALGRWRQVTVERRTAWDAEHAKAVKAMLERRRTALITASIATFCSSVVVGSLIAVFALPGSSAIASSAPIQSAAVIPFVGDGEVLSPERDVAKFVPGVQGDVRSWGAGNALWVHFDYSGSPLTLQWTDGAGKAVMNPMPCVNSVSKSTKRCFVGRSRERVRTALDVEGAVPGTWTVHACRGVECAPVANYSVE